MSAKDMTDAQWLEIITLKEKLAAAAAQGHEVERHARKDDEEWTDKEIEAAMRGATQTAFDVMVSDEGILFVWDENDPLSYMWQTRAQARDLVEKLKEIL